MCRPTEEGRNSCVIAVGIDHVGVALLSLVFHQHGTKGVKSQGLRLLPHTAPVLRMCVAWDFTPAVCSFPASSSNADAAATSQTTAAGSAPSQGEGGPQDQWGSAALDPTAQPAAAAAVGSIEQAESSTDGQVSSLCDQGLLASALPMGVVDHLLNIVDHRRFLLGIGMALSCSAKCQMTHGKIPALILGVLRSGTACQCRRCTNQDYRAGVCTHSGFTAAQQR